MIPLLATVTCFAVDTWHQPPDEILEVLHAPTLPGTWVSPDGKTMLMATPVQYPPLADQAADMHPLAGLRVDGRNNGYHGQSGYALPSILRVSDGRELSVTLPADARILGVYWSADSERLALTVRHPEHIGLWVGTPDGAGAEVDGVAVNPLLGSAVTWMPDQGRLLVKAVPTRRGDAPERPLVPAGPMIREGDGATATSTYEARDVLNDAHDEALFEYFTTSQLVTVDARDRSVAAIGPPGIHADVDPSPGGDLILVETLRGPWSRRHAWWRFGHTIEVWDTAGKAVHTVTSQPVADSVPIHGVPEGPRTVGWRQTAPATLVWVEALDGGDWSNEVDHRDRLMMHAAPFAGEAAEVYRAPHRASGWLWVRGGQVLVTEYERARRWQYARVVDVDVGSARPLYDLSVNDRYHDPGSPVLATLPGGERVVERVGDDIFFAGAGSSPDGDRPFLDRRSLRSGAVTRLFRSHPDRHERFAGFVDAKKGRFFVRRESPTEPPNTWLARVGRGIAAAPGEAAHAVTMEPVTRFEDPAPQIRGIERRILTYERADGVPLSATLYLPPGYVEGTRLPTVVHAYPREFSDPETAGQVRGSEKTFTELRGTSHLFFLLRGYAVLHNTRMPVIGDPDTAYDTFVEQLVAGAEAAVDEAVRIGVTDPDRVGVTGHSHGGLMTVTLLAHSDRFKAGIARSGAYNHTIRPFGFQSERRTLWQAPETYTHLSPVMHAPKINEPLLLIHGAMDQNPGTVPLQSERLFEAVRGTGGTVRLVMLPFEGHGYRAKESVEHVLWEEIDWFDTYVKGVSPGQ